MVTLIVMFILSLVLFRANGYCNIQYNVVEFDGKW